MLALLTGIFLLYVAVFGMVWGIAVASLSVISVLYLLNNIVAMGLYDLDAVLMKIPVIGGFYEALLRPNTYYREDTRLMYCDLVNRIVRSKVEEFAGEQDVTNVDFLSDPVPLGTGLSQLVRGAVKKKVYGAKADC